MSNRAPKPKDSIEALLELAGSGSDTSARSESVSDAIGGQRNTCNDPPATVPPSRAFEAALGKVEAAHARFLMDDSVEQASVDDLHAARAELVRLYDEALAQRDQRDNEVVARLRRQIHEAEDHDVAVFGAQSNAELAEALRSTMPWIPTALHALLHSAAARLAAPPPGESVEGVVVSGPHGDTPPPSLLRAYRDLPIVAPASGAHRGGDVSDNDALLAEADALCAGEHDDDPLCNGAGDAYTAGDHTNRITLRIGHVRALTARVRELEAERDSVSRALVSPGAYLLDPPDGGDVPLNEQIARLVAILAALREDRARLLAALSAEDARGIAEQLFADSRRASDQQRYAIEHGYGDDRLAGNEASEVLLGALFGEEARRTHEWAIACRRLAAAIDAERKEET